MSDDDKKTCSCCNRIVSLECFEKNRTGELFKQCNSCREKQRESRARHREEHDMDTKTCPRCKQGYRTINYSEKKHMLNWSCYKTILTNPTKEDYYKFIYENKDEKQLSRWNKQEIPNAIKFIESLAEAPASST
jgi:hypothetical protein